MAAAPPDLKFRPIQNDDVPAAARLEAACYPPDEAASLEKIAFRAANAGKYFLLMLADNQLIGFVNGTLTAGRRLTQETMSVHNPDGDHLCIHSVAVDPKLRRQGLGWKVLRAYLEHIQANCREVRRVSLIAKEHLAQPFYCGSGLGFELVGKSDVVHGQDPWFECTVALERPPSQQ